MKHNYVRSFQNKGHGGWGRRVAGAGSVLAAAGESFGLHFLTRHPMAITFDRHGRNPIDKGNGSGPGGGLRREERTDNPAR